MAISRTKKMTIVQEVSKLLSTAKLTAFANYEGLTVSEFQELRRAARENGIVVKVAKNRLVAVALQQTTAAGFSDKDALKGQLLYAMSATDEVAPAQTLAKFAKNHDTLKLIGGINAAGDTLNEVDIKVLASLPSKEQLRGQLVGTIAAPISGFVHVLSGNVRGVLQVLSARGETIN